MKWSQGTESGDHFENTKRNNGLLTPSPGFLTTDDRLLKYKSERIEIIDPIEFIRRIGGEEDD